MTTAAESVQPESWTGHSEAAADAWPWSAAVLLLLICPLYAPSLASSAHEWLTNDSYSHGLCIFPVSALLLYARRGRIAEAVRSPDLWRGAPLLALGAGLQAGCWLLRIKYVGMWSLAPSLMGVCLLAHGRGLLRIALFPICFLLFSAPIPNTLLDSATLWMRQMSVEGSYHAMTALGYPLIRQGNLLQLPGATLEIADACSGVHKLVAFAAFAFLYGYASEAPLGRRLILIASVIPVALLTNVARICVLVAATAAGGLGAFHMAHDASEFAVILLGAGLFALIGKVLGCNPLRFASR